MAGGPGTGVCVGSVTRERVHPAVALGLARLPVGESVGTVVRDTGLSHRRFIRLFRDSVGLSPKAWARVLRFRRAVKALAAGLTRRRSTAASIRRTRTTYRSCTEGCCKYVQDRRTPPA